MGAKDLNGIIIFRKENILPELLICSYIYTSKVSVPLCNTILLTFIIRVHKIT
ncbi:hypothetical protein RhiirA1_205344 [Rhizophagus irregularis]|uniref:Uncharacterized protein n=1 Tax=Rhizophagus irregularis TaxID=588596 RepID=A0A2N0RPI0_9GLOM|nr:hypothetical protein RhiirA1_205344 [Rhizophagus irregularis]